MTASADDGAAPKISTRRLRLAAAALAYVVATVHLFHPRHGARRLVRLAARNPGALATDPRPLLFTLSGLAIVAGVFLAIRRLPERPIAGAGIGLMVTYLAGYLGWHLSGHGGFLPNREPLYHDLTPTEAVIAHLGSDGFAFVAFWSELALLVVLAVLWRRLEAEA